MKKLLPLFFFLLALASCKKEKEETISAAPQVANSVKYANGLEIYRHNGYSIVKVTQPWPEAKEGFTYIMHKKGAAVPNSLKSFTSIEIPVKSIVVTSTTHIPALELLGVSGTLTGFPGTDYISSPRTRRHIDEGKVKEIGANESLNTEVVIDLAPDAIVGFSISNDNKALANLQQSGLKVLYNGDWTEQTPLGKAEWIKFFGELYGLEKKADAAFNMIEKEYKAAMLLAKKSETLPTVLSGAIYQEHWYLPQGSSWAAQFLKDAHAQYLWAESEGTGSLSLSFETVLDKAKDADYWIGPSQFTSLQEMLSSNPHYKEFKAFQNKQVYSFSSKKGKTGGILYYELASSRPDIVLKDLIKIFHPELLPEHEFTFFEKLK
ncbi:ABC transporter substrate-binding protein [Flavobacterium sp. MK4S-17]|uniref:ABC transporter substrate-binding protein n=1 Tax=Flavobacterium sp. MK4S-17 TaxID=2543737 RepID=UPI001357518B|nr:ABC transporter substrate-binding protein [Flavobacterium sp. MK4S-17]